MASVVIDQTPNMGTVTFSDQLINLESKLKVVLLALDIAASA
jgi:hypothetical protein